MSSGRSSNAWRQFDGGRALLYGGSAVIVHDSPPGWQIPVTFGRIGPHVEATRFSGGVASQRATASLGEGPVAGGLGRGLLPHLLPGSGRRARRAVRQAGPLLQIREDRRV